MGHEGDAALSSPFTGFTRLVVATRCPYASRARVRLVPHVYKQNSADFLTAFRDSEHWLARPDTDAVVIAIEAIELGANLAAQANTFREVVERISGMLISAEVLATGWQLEIAGTRTFATFLSPTYPADNPRAVTGDYGYVMLQPEHSFHRLLPRERLNPGRRDMIKASIRRAFRDAGMEYDPLDADPPTEAQKYVKPSRLGDPVVAWWVSGDDNFPADASRSE